MTSNAAANVVEVRVMHRPSGLASLPVIAAGGEVWIARQRPNGELVLVRSGENADHERVTETQSAVVNRSPLLLMAEWRIDGRAVATLDGLNHEAAAIFEPHDERGV